VQRRIAVIAAAAAIALAATAGHAQPVPDPPATDQPTPDQPWPDPRWPEDPPEGAVPPIDPGPPPPDDPPPDDAAAPVPPLTDDLLDPEGSSGDVGTALSGALGPLVTIEDIQLVGNRSTASRVVERALPFRRGDVLRTSDVRLARAHWKLLALGYFRDASISLRKGSARGRVIVTVIVRERGTIALNRLWFGSSEVAPWWLGADLSDRNFAGTGLVLGGAVAYSSPGAIAGARAQWAGELRLGVPAINGGRWGAHLALTGQHGSEPFRVSGPDGSSDPDDLRAFSYRRLGARGGASLMWSTLTSVTADLRVESIDAAVPVAPTRALPDGRITAIDLGLRRGDSRVVSLGLAVSRDTRPDPALPHQGTRAELAAELGTSLLGGSYDFAVAARPLRSVLAGDAPPRDRPAGRRRHGDRRRPALRSHPHRRRRSHAVAARARHDHRAHRAARSARHRQRRRGVRRARRQRRRRVRVSLVASPPAHLRRRRVRRGRRVGPGHHRRAARARSRLVVGAADRSGARRRRAHRHRDRRVRVLAVQRAGARAAMVTARRAAVVAALVVALGLGATVAADNRPELRDMKFAERGSTLYLTTDVTSVFDEAAYHRLEDGLLSTVVIRLWVFPKGSKRPLAFQLLHREMVYDLWGEAYEVALTGPNGRRVYRVKYRAEALKLVTELHQFAMADLSVIPYDEPIEVAVVAELNPVSAPRPWPRCGAGCPTAAAAGSIAAARSSARSCRCS
jgi:hypothetical protein